MASGTCIVCGCTEGHACVDPATGETCGWFEPSQELCNFCVARVLNEPLAEAEEYAPLTPFAKLEGLRVLVRTIVVSLMQQAQAAQTAAVDRPGLWLPPTFKRL